MYLLPSTVYRLMKPSEWSQAKICSTLAVGRYGRICEWMRAGLSSRRPSLSAMHHRPANSSVFTSGAVPSISFVNNPGFMFRALMYVPSNSPPLGENEHPRLLSLSPSAASRPRFPLRVATARDAQSQPAVARFDHDWRLVRVGAADVASGRSANRQGYRRACA